ncbi:MAG: serine acetyltransferase [Chthoniobacteraceae bacterium]
MDKDLDKITTAILASYETGGINHIDGANLPSKRALASICEDLLQLLFPGFHDREPIHSSHLRRVTAHRVYTIADRLKEEICKSLRLREPGCPEANAEKLLFDFLERLPSVRDILRTDVDAAFEGDPAATTVDEIILAYPYIETVAIQRMAHVLYDLCLPLIPRIMTEWAHSRTGIDIHPGAEIGPSFFIDHGTGVVIGETASLGHHVKLYQGVALIARSLAGGQALRGKKRHPTVEDHVTIYAGTTVMGGDTVIGAGSTVGANVFVTKSIPARSLVYYEERQLTILDKDQRAAVVDDDWMI